MADAFRWDDPFLLEDQLSEEERMLRDAARAFCEERLAPRVREAFRREETDPAIFREMGEAGLLGVTVPEEYGGLGRGVRRLRPHRAGGRADRLRGTAR